jgi:hypothetical protein
MFTTRLLLIIAAICIACGSSTASASPISYAFSGTLMEPYNGSSAFSGTFTYNTSLQPLPDVQPYPGWSYYSGVPTDPTDPPVSLNFNVGGVSSSSFGNVSNLELIVTHTNTGDGFYIEENLTSPSGQATFANIGMVNINAVQPGPFGSTDPPSSLSLSSFSMGPQLDLMIGYGTSDHVTTVVGTITSLTQILPAPVPEPGSLPVFAILAAPLVCAARSKVCRPGGKTDRR